MLASCAPPPAAQATVQAMPPDRVAAPVTVTRFLPRPAVTCLRPVHAASPPGRDARANSVWTQTASATQNPSHRVGAATVGRGGGASEAEASLFCDVMSTVGASSSTSASTHACAWPCKRTRTSDRPGHEMCHSLVSPAAVASCRSTHGVPVPMSWPSRRAAHAAARAACTVRAAAAWRSWGSRRGNTRRCGSLQTPGPCVVAASRTSQKREEVRRSQPREERPRGASAACKSKARRNSASSAVNAVASSAVASAPTSSLVAEMGASQQGRACRQKCRGAALPTVAVAATTPGSVPCASP